EQQKRLFLDQWGPTMLPSADLKVSDRVMGNIEQARGEFWGIMNGVTAEGVDDTASGLVYAAIEIQQHVAAVRGADEGARADGTSRRAYLDRDSLVTVAVGLAREVANA